MNECYSYREIDIIDNHIDINRVRTIGDSWGVSITEDGKVRIPVCSYADILPLIKKRPETK